MWPSHCLSNRGTEGGGLKEWVKRMSKVTALGSWAAFLCISVGVLASPEKATVTVTVDTGVLSGSAKDGVISFKGIPYAAPPVGDLRWRPPQPVAAWSGVRSATQYGHDCMQLPDPSEAAPLGTTKPSEDCLVLNVWAPVRHSGEKAAVMVWIHGGGFLNGGSSAPIYDGSALAEKGVVFVSFNFRLGRFGFFAHPALTQESPAGPLGNYTYMDQIAALKWVKRNIAAFGGDPDNVTVVGESAGGGSVHMLMNSPLAEGLFSKGIIESGGGRDGGNPRRVHGEGTELHSVPSGESLGIEFAASQGINGQGSDALRALRALPAEKIVNGMNVSARRADPSIGATFAGPMVDGQIVVESSERHVSGTQTKIPIIIGTNSSDLAYPQEKTMAELFAPFGGNSDQARKEYDPDNSNNVHEVGLLIARDRGMTEPARYLARVLTTQGHHVYEYRFSYIAESMRKQWQGAPHASEVPYVFDTVSARYGKDLDPADETVATTINAYWVAFAKTGNPNGAGRANWPAYNPERDVLVDFTEKGVVAKPDPLRARLDLMEQTHQHTH
jgi:para-nitrobenzyl esterase